MVNLLECGKIEKLNFPVDGDRIYDAKILRSVDGGKTWWYAGTGKFCKTEKEAQEYINNYLENLEA